ncbi:cytochrome P450 [Streptomyces sp. Act143]|uniref:cytochrome P450 n=1 Tax=Streptomyces sp. Act143 TaxID=2200760 RepID=UPI0015E822D2|nr:cytochrome P450 [Streptomyces sp. Act143]
MTERLTRGFAVTNREPKCPFDPSRRLAEMGRQEIPPVVPMYEPRFGDADVHLVSRYADVRAVLADRRLRYSHLPQADGNPRTFMPGFLPDFDGAEHVRLRRMISGIVAPKHVHHLRPVIEQTVEQCLDEMDKAGPGADLIAAYALAVPSTVISEVLGVPPAFRDEFHTLSTRIVNFANAPAEYFAHLAKFGAYMTELVDDIRRRPAEGLISSLLQGHHGEVSNAEVIGLSSALVVAGHETTASMIGVSALALIQQPEQLALLLDENVATADAVEELLRYMSVSGVFPRAATEDVTFDGWQVKEGERVLVSLLNANRDPELLADPDRLDLSRAPVAHVAFGHGPHQCPGQQLARMELQLALPALFRRFPALRLAVPAEDLVFHRDGPNVYSVAALPVTW